MFTKCWMLYVFFCMQLNAQRCGIFEGTTNNAAMHIAFSHSSQIDLKNYLLLFKEHKTETLMFIHEAAKLCWSVQLNNCVRGQPYCNTWYCRLDHAFKFDFLTVSASFALKTVTAVYSRMSGQLQHTMPLTTKADITHLTICSLYKLGFLTCSYM